MNFKVNIQVCRVCMKPEEGFSLFRDLDLHYKFVFTTRLSIKASDNMPSLICSKCVGRLKIAFDFIKLAHASEKNLKAFLTKISSDFEEVTKSTCSSSVSSPSLEHEEVDDDTLMLFEETIGEDANSNVCDSSEATKEVRSKQDSKNKPTNKNTKQDQLIETPFLAKIEPCAAQEIEIVKQEAVECIINNEKMCTEVTELNAEAEIVEDEEVVYYEDANFLDESETDEMDQKHIQFRSKTTEDFMQDDETTTKSDNVEEQERQINGYLEEYNSMLAEQEAASCNNQNYSKRYNYSDDGQEEILEDHMEQEVQALVRTTVAAVATIDEEILNLYEDTEDDVEADDHMTTEHDRVSDLREELNVETLENTDECLTEEYDLAHPIELKATNQHEDDRRQSKISTQQKQIGKPKRTSSSMSSAAINARFFCVRCNRDFSTKTNLTRHMATHEGIKPYKCTECNKSFSQNGSLKQHMYTHTGEKPFTCEVCNRGFTQCKSLVFHMRRHTGEKPFPCEHCGTFFRQKDGLKTHILKHHMIRQSNGDTETHICDICNKLLSTKYALQVHMKKHVNNHKLSPNPINTLSVAENTLIDLLSEDDVLNDKTFINDELALNIDDVTSSTQILDTMTANTAKASRAKKFQCRKCFKCFAIKKNLLRHLTTHDVSPSELFQCQTCQVAYDTNYALRVHRVREHKETGINLNECEICNITFTNVNELSEHNNAMHDATGQKCPECPELHFKTQKQLLEHLIEHESLSNEIDDEGI